MTLTDDILQQYFDGELPEGEAAQVRTALDASPDARARLESLGTLRKLLVRAAASMAADIASDDLYARVRAKIDAEKAAGYGEPFEVIDGELDARDVCRLERGREASRVGRMWWFAAAAVALLAFAPPVIRWVSGSRSQLPPVAVAPPSPVAPPPAGTQIVEVEFGPGRTGTVFAIEGSAGEPIAVVWINDEGN